MNQHRRSLLKAGLCVVGAFIAGWLVLHSYPWKQLQQLASPLSQEPVYAQSAPENTDAGFEPVPVNPGSIPPASSPETNGTPSSVPATPPTASSPINLVGSLPANEATDVTVSSRIELQFSGALNESIDTLDLTIEPAISLEFNVADDRIVLEPSSPLGYSTQYTVTIPQQEALPLTEPVQVSFKTEPEFTYDIDVKPLLDVSCVGCHGAFDTSRSAALLDTYSGVLSVVNPGSADSPLIASEFTQPHARRRSGSQSIAQRYMRINSYPLDKLGSWSPAEIELVTTWVVQDEAVESSPARRARFEQGS